MIKVGINGYGTIGRRVAFAVLQQPDMVVSGIVKTKPDYVSEIASSTYKIFVPDRSYMNAFDESGIKVSGTLEDLVNDSDIIVDATPEGQGEKDKSIYVKAGKKAIFEGGESESIADASFNAYSNYNSAIGKNFVRVVSCNTTALARTLFPLNEKFGIKKVSATLIRRATDQNDSKKGPINAVEPSLKIPSHHAPDLKTVISGFDINTVAIKVPTTLMHVHVIDAEMKNDLNKEDVISAWEGFNRIMGLKNNNGITSTAQIMDLAREFGRDRSDLYEIAIWLGSVGVDNGHLHYIQAVHQESDVIPENIDAIRAMFEMNDREKSIEIPDRSLKITKRLF
ncbi:MAG: type II glyceraldehyde-3-phosphate dehydrogenase [Thermoplasmata archaeon]